MSYYNWANKETYKMYKELREDFEVLCELTEDRNFLNYRIRKHGVEEAFKGLFDQGVAQSIGQALISSALQRVDWRELSRKTRERKAWTIRVVQGIDSHAWESEGRIVLSGEVQSPERFKELASNTILEVSPLQIVGGRPHSKIVRTTTGGYQYWLVGA